MGVRTLDVVSALPWMVVFAAGALFLGAVSLLRHGRFASNAFDLGVFDQTVWGYSRFRILPNTVAIVPNLLGDHFHPILVTLAPLYWIWNDAGVLLVAQGVLIAAGSIPVFLWAQARLGLLAALLLQAAFLVFWGTLAGNIFDFHELAFAVPLVSFALYAVLTGRNRLLWPMVVLGLLTKEDLALTFLFLGVYIALVKRRWRLGLTLAGVCAAWFTALVSFVIPAVAGSAYRHWTYTGLGSDAASALAHIVRHPIDSARLFFSPFQKVKILAGLMVPWLLLPLVSPILIVAIPSLAERFWSANPLLWSTHFQYSMVPGVILAFATIDGLARLKTLLGSRLRPAMTAGVTLAVLVTNLGLTFLVAQPLAEVRGYISSARAAEIASCLELIPTDASVSASNYLLAHLAQRREIYLLNAKSDADYLAIDTSMYRPLAQQEAQIIRSSIVHALATGYGVVCSKRETLVLQRGWAFGQLSPQMQRFLEAGP